MKNQRILVIASLLLILCVFEKQARYKAMRGETVEKMYNIPERSKPNAPVFTQNEAEVSTGDKSLYDPAHLLRFTASDTIVDGGTANLANQNLLNISSAGKILQY